MPDSLLSHIVMLTHLYYRTGPKQHTLPATDKGHMKVEVDKKGL